MTPSNHTPRVLVQSEIYATVRHTTVDQEKYGTDMSCDSMGLYPRALRIEDRISAIDVIHKKVQKHAKPVRFTLILKTAIFRCFMLVLCGTCDTVSSAIRHEANRRSSGVKMLALAGESSSIKYKITPKRMERSPSKKKILCQVWIIPQAGILLSPVARSPP